VTKNIIAVFFSIEYYLGIFSIGLIFFHSLEEVISSGEVSEGNTYSIQST